MGEGRRGTMMYVRKQLHLVSNDRTSWQLPVFLVCLALIAVALLTRDALGQETVGTGDFDLRGTVVDQASGQSLVGAFVSMTDSEWGSLSNDEGQFRIPHLRAGSVSLTVELLGYETLERTRTRCSGRAIGSVCFFVRGREAESMVYVDEMPVIGGLDYLDVLRPHELYMVEVYGQGRHIRVYTNHFMERAAKKRLRPGALLF